MFESPKFFGHKRRPKFHQCCGFVTFWYRIRIHGIVPLTNGSGSATLVSILIFSGRMYSTIHSLENFLSLLPNYNRKFVFMCRSGPDRKWLFRIGSEQSKKEKKIRLWDTTAEDNPPPPPLQAEEKIFRRAERCIRPQNVTPTPLPPILRPAQGSSRQNGKRHQWMHC